MNSELTVQVSDTTMLKKEIMLATQKAIIKKQLNITIESHYHIIELSN